MKSSGISPPFDLSNIRYCSTHNSHWIPGEELIEDGCPWCSLDSYKKSVGFKPEEDLNLQSLDLKPIGEGITAKIIIGEPLRFVSGVKPEEENE